MQRSFAVVTLILLLATASTAVAASTPTFTATPGADQTVTFDASASVCEFGPCGYDWRWDNGTRLGVTMGSGVRITYRFPVSGPQTVVLKVSGHCAAGSINLCSASVSQQVIVPPAASGPAPAPPPPPPPPPPPAPAPAPAPRKASPALTAKAGQTVKVTIARAKVDKAPGRAFIGTIFKGNRFRIDRVKRVTHGPAKGRWLHGTATVTGKHARGADGRIRPLQITGWVRATAFA
jgi:hypothetical protein